MTKPGNAHAQTRLMDLLCLFTRRVIINLDPMRFQQALISPQSPHEIQVGQLASPASREGGSRRDTFCTCFDAVPTGRFGSITSDLSLLTQDAGMATSDLRRSWRRFLRGSGSRSRKHDRQQLEVDAEIAAVRSPRWQATTL